MEGIVSINGQVFPLSEAKISVLDRGFLFCDSVFEVILGLGPSIIGLDEHIARLRYSGERIGFSVPWTDEQLRKEVSNLCKTVSFPKSYIRISLTRGEGLGLIPQKDSYNKLIYIMPAPVSPSRIYSEGICIKTVGKQLNTRGPSIKNPYYIQGIISLLQYKDEGYEDVLWVNSDDEITEATTSNIFFIGREGSSFFVDTPSLDCGLLSGITRLFVIKLLRKHNIEVRETPILREELARYDEAFLTSTIRGLVPVQKIDEKKFASLRKEALFPKIHHIFHSWVESKVGRSLDWNKG